MFVETLKIENLRNIGQAEIDLSPVINILTGANGAGKTTVLEAVYLLARARSFRKGDQRALIQQGKRDLLLYARLVDGQGIRHRIGQTRQGSGAEYKLDGKPAKRLSEIARVLPVTLITPQSHRILEEGPENRRRLLNWGVFHVEHEYKGVIGDFLRTLNQRNNALKSGSRDLSVWNSALVQQSKAVNERQSAYVERWKNVLKDLCSDIHFLKDIEMSFYRGWSNDSDLSDVLRDGQERDREKGYTRAGPQRCDLIFKVGGLPSKQILSRGQQKILIILILLAQAKILEQSNGEKPIILVDDLNSELDESSIKLTCDLLDKQGCQTLITSTAPKEIEAFRWSTIAEMFHVEHGRFV